MRQPRIVSRSHFGASSRKITAPTASADVFQTPKSATSRTNATTQSPAFVARRAVGGSASQRSRGSPTAPRPVHQAREIDCTMRRRTSGSFGGSLAEQALGTEDEDQDEDREDDRLRP